tara:strand:- start:335 stop:586 length:252 start_codon:yes stop_codon:yes gene_type:complete
VPSKKKRSGEENADATFFSRLLWAFGLSSPAEVIPPRGSIFYFKLQDTDTDGCGGGLVAELFGYGLSQLQVKAAPRSSHSTVS